jgi:hypothetical protein
MFLEPISFALAATATMSISYIAYSIAMAFFPKFFLRTHASMIHLVHYQKYANDIKVTLESFVWGLAQVLFHSFVTAWFFAFLYNYLLAR